MRTLKTQKFWIGPALLVLLLGACKGESPTAPPTGNPPGGNVPPSNVNIALASSNASPLTDSETVITATVTLNGAPVANGTAVEFTTNSGTLDDGVTSVIKTTTNGVASVTLTSSAPGTVRVSATVNNVSRTIDVTFQERPTEEPDPVTTPTISSVSPSVGTPAGGQTIRITGTNFTDPVRVLFDTGGARPLEGLVVSSSETTIDVLTPGVNLGAGQQLVADVIVITEAGSTDEDRAELADGFTFQAEKLTPVFSTASPNAGPVTGGTRVTIFGEGFQAPVQVLFGSAEARVIDVKYAQILVEAPNGRSTSPDGSETVTGPVDITVRNILSNTAVTAPAAFRYIANMVIVAISPSEGPATGGTRLVIEGIGFVGPVAVTVAGVTAMPVDVTGTRLVVITPALDLTTCSDVSGPVVVTNIVNGDTATGGSFTFEVPQPVILDVVPSTQAPGGSITVTVLNAQGGPTRFKVDDNTITPTGATANDDGTTDFTMTLPPESAFEFETEECTENGVVGERTLDLTVDVVYQDLPSGCTDTLEGGLTIDVDNTCVLPPPEVTQTAPAVGSCADAGSVSIVDPATGTASITFRNDGGGTLTVTAGTPTGTNATEFTISPPLISVAPGDSDTFTVTFDPEAVGARTATVDFTTNDPDDGEATVTVCLEGEGI